MDKQIVAPVAALDVEAVADLAGQRDAPVEQVAEISPVDVAMPIEALQQAPANPFDGFLQDNATVRVGTWAGFPNYECSACQFAHLDEAKTQAHISIHGQTFTQGVRP